MFVVVFFFQDKSDISGSQQSSSFLKVAFPHSLTFTLFLYGWRGGSAVASHTLSTYALFSLSYSITQTHTCTHAQFENIFEKSLSTSVVHFSYSR